MTKEEKIMFHEKRERLFLECFCKCTHFNLVKLSPLLSGVHWDGIIEKQNFFKGNVKGVLIPSERSVDINNKSDIEYAEQVLKDLS